MKKLNNIAIKIWRNRDSPIIIIMGKREFECVCEIKKIRKRIVQL